MTLIATSCRVAFRALPGTRGIKSKALREVVEKPAPYDWKNKNYPLWRTWFDNTTSRFDENTKLIIVEGPVASGKTAFAKELANQLDMLHMEDANMDMFYITPAGYDFRQIDHKFPKDMRAWDENLFNKDPLHRNIATFQAWMYRLRLGKYVDALAHLLSTGQGVVLERTPWTDMVFTESMTKHKYISKEARYVINNLKIATLPLLMRPHVVVYLDVPVTKVQENIKKRNKYSEVNGKALTTAYLEDVEEQYKTKYLPEISQHAELLIYDWADPGDVEIVVEDIERLDLDKYSKHDSKMIDWLMSQERDWAEKRRLYADEKEKFLLYLNIPLLDAPEMWASGEDIYQFLKLWKSLPGNEYEVGFNPKMGDNHVFKFWNPKYIAY